MTVTRPRPRFGWHPEGTPPHVALFKQGDRVRHKVFTYGIGVVEYVNPDGHIGVKWPSHGSAIVPSDRLIHVAHS